MLEIMKEIGGPQLGVTAIGAITAEDYESILIPAVEQRLKSYEKIGLLCHLGLDYEGFTLGAAWDDAKFGVMHLADFTRLALVSDIGWVRNAVRIFAPLLRYPVQVFRNDELEQAKQWLAEGISESVVL